MGKESERGAGAANSNLGLKLDPYSNHQDLRITLGQDDDRRLGEIKFAQDLDGVP